MALTAILHHPGNDRLARYGMQLSGWGIKEGQIVHLPGVRNALADYGSPIAPRLPAPEPESVRCGAPVRGGPLHPLPRAVADKSVSSAITILCAHFATGALPSKACSAASPVAGASPSPVFSPPARQVNVSAQARWGTHFATSWRGTCFRCACSRSGQVSAAPTQPSSPPFGRDTLPRGSTPSPRAASSAQSASPPPCASMPSHGVVPVPPSSLGPVRAIGPRSPTRARVLRLPRIHREAQLEDPVLGEYIQVLEQLNSTGRT